MEGRDVDAGFAYQPWADSASLHSVGVVTLGGDARARSPRSGAPRQPKNNSPRHKPEELTGWPLTAPTGLDVELGATRSTRACLAQAWSFVTVSTVTGEAQAHRFRCKSWRCPNCRYPVARQDFARILEALSSKSARAAQWVLLTLTFDPSKYANQWAAYRAGGRAWQKLRRRLARRYRFKSLARIRYVAVWERHKSGWPHVHIALSCPELVQEIRTLGQCVSDVDGYGSTRWDARAHKRLPNWAWKPRVLEDLAIASGFGRVSDVQFPRAKEGGVAGYFAKLSAELVGMFDQRPVNAPKHFRRLRASLRTLPPRRRSTGELLGRLEQRPLACVASELLSVRWPANAARHRRNLIQLWQSIRPNRAPSVGVRRSGAGSRSTSRSATGPPRQLSLFVPIHLPHRNPLHPEQ